MGLKNETVSLESNFKCWKKLFESEKECLIKLINQENILIEHVGSTSVEGLLAKPIVDIAVGMNNYRDVLKYFDILKERYTIKINDEYDEILLIKEKGLETFFLIHILNKNDNRFKDMLKFRDILKNNNDILNQYEQLKIHLSNIYANDRKMYTKSKNDFIQKVLNNLK